MIALALTRRLLRTAAKPRIRYASYSTAPKKSDPLRILFCGSDEFSCESLRALHHEHTRNADLIRSIDVVVRPSKPTGRGYKVLREVPIRSLADKLGLPVHVRDTFTGWDMPKPSNEPINLIVAVSFGLFVPPRLLNAAKYGGVNVHPSLLPDLRGPAPLHHALLNSYTHTGITIQTLSPHSFDAGAILLQTPRPGTPIPPDCTVAQLHGLLAPAGAAMLVEALRRGLHVPPHPGQPGRPGAGETVDRMEGEEKEEEREPRRHAPKITPADRQVRWTGTGTGTAGSGPVRGSIASDAALRARVLGPLWTHLRVARRRGGHRDGGNDMAPAQKRVILEEISVAEPPSPSTGVHSSDAGDGGGSSGGVVEWVEMRDGKGGEKTEEDVVALKYFFPEEDDGGAVVMGLPDGSWMRIGKIKVEGTTSKPARRVLEGIGMK